MARRFTNLAPQALRDLVDIIDRSASRYGAAQAERVEERIFVTCRNIASGLDHGHVRQDVTTRRPTRFIVVKPFVIAYDPETRLVDRILDGRRSFTRLFGELTRDSRR